MSYTTRTKKRLKTTSQLTYALLLFIAREYYNKFNLSLAYYAATILYPCYKYYCDVA
jgi:hypothetical protein